eukprot:7584153-Prorocentrum_lima.AAC.1
MSLKSVLIKIGTMQQGIVMHMYNRMFRWNGNNDIVDYMAGTRIVEVNGVTGRLLQTTGHWACILKE